MRGNFTTRFKINKNMKNKKCKRKAACQDIPDDVLRKKSYRKYNCSGITNNLKLSSNAVDLVHIYCSRHEHLQRKIRKKKEHEFSSRLMLPRQQCQWKPKCSTKKTFSFQNSLSSALLNTKVSSLNQKVIKADKCVFEKDCKDFVEKYYFEKKKDQKCNQSKAVLATTTLLEDLLSLKYIRIRNVDFQCYFAVEPTLINHPLQINGILWKDFRHEILRLATFSNYPKSATKSSLILAGDGFVYIGSGTDDTVMCYSCCGKKSVWLENENVAQIHGVMSPNCSMVTGIESNNVPIKEVRMMSFDNSSIITTNQTIIDSDGSSSVVVNKGTENLLDIQTDAAPWVSQEHDVRWDAHKPTNNNSARHDLQADYISSISTSTLKQNNTTSNRHNLQADDISSISTSTLKQNNPTSNRHNLHADDISSISTSTLKQYNPTSNRHNLHSDDISSISTSTLKQYNPTSNSKSNYNHQKQPQVEGVKKQSFPETASSFSQFATLEQANIIMPFGAQQDVVPSASTTVTAGILTTKEPIPSPPQIATALEKNTKPSSSMQNSQSQNNNVGASANNLTSSGSASHQNVSHSATTTPHQNTGSNHVTSNGSSTANSTNKGGQGPTYSELGIVTERPKRSEYAVKEQRRKTFSSWPRSHHIEVDDLADAGFYYAGYGDCARCFFCGGGLRNWEDEDDDWVEHARWFPKCAFIRQLLGQNFVDAVQELNKTKDKITLKMVKEHMGASSLVFQLDSIKNPLKRDPAVKALVQSGCDEINVLEVAGCFKSQESPLSADLLLNKYRSMGYSVPFTDQMLKPLEKSTATADLETMGKLKEKNNSLREQIRCKVCMDNDVEVVFLPCGHLVSCAECAGALNGCPVCRKSIKGTVRAFLG